MEGCWETGTSKRYNRAYYINKEKGVSQWGKSSINDLDLPTGWEAHVSLTVNPGEIYYGNVSKKTIQLEFPDFEDEPILPSGWEKIRSKCGNYYYVNKETTHSQWEIPTFVPVLEEEEEDYVHVTEPLIDQPRALKWTANSCYLDSSLFAFFAGPKKFIDEMLNMSLHDKTNRMVLKDCNGQDWETNLEHRKAIQDELKKIYKSITRTGDEVEYCTELRRTLENCPVQEKYHEGVTADAGEFITYLTDLFPTNKNILITDSYLTNAFGIDLPNLLEQYPDTVKTKIIDAVSLVHVINIDKMQQIRDEQGVANLSGFLIQEEDSGKLQSDPYVYDEAPYYRSIQVRSLIFSPYLIFSLKRLPYAGAELDETMVIPDEIIILGGDKFTLSGAVMHTGGCHYVAIAKYNDVWWYYNDNEYKVTETLLRFETWTDFIRACVSGESLINPVTHGTQFYYSPAERD